MLKGLRLALGVLLAGLLAAGCSARETTPAPVPGSAPTSPTTGVAHVRELAAAAAPGMVEPYLTNVTTKVETVALQPNREGLPPGVSQYLVLALVTASPKSDPSVQLPARCLGVMRSDGVGGMEPYMGGLTLDIYDDVAALSPEYRQPFASYISTGALAATSTLDVRVCSLDARELSFSVPMLSRSVGARRLTPIGFQHALVDLARRHGYASDHAAYVTYFSLTPRQTERYRQQILGFDRANRRWVLLASRIGDEGGRFVEAK
jgi:hypothetical protein